MNTPSPHALHPSPADGEVFELTLDGDAVDPMEMARRDTHARDWKFDGTRLTGTHSRRFKLVCVGDQQGFDAVRTALVAHGRIPEGQWRDAFKAAYPLPDNLVGVADPSWVRRSGRRFFPTVHTGRSGGDTDFHWAGFESFSDDFHWLVEVD